MATFIHWTGREIEIHPTSPAHGFAREELRKLLDCHTISMSTLDDGRLMIVDEDAKLKLPRIPVNIRATKLYQVGRPTGWAIVGNVIVADPREIQ